MRWSRPVYKRQVSSYCLMRVEKKSDCTYVQGRPMGHVFRLLISGLQGQDWGRQIRIYTSVCCPELAIYYAAIYCFIHICRTFPSVHVNVRKSSGNSRNGVIYCTKMSRRFLVPLASTKTKKLSGFPFWIPLVSRSQCSRRQTIKTRLGGMCISCSHPSFIRLQRRGQNRSMQQWMMGELEIQSGGRGLTPARSVAFIREMI